MYAQIKTFVASQEERLKVEEQINDWLKGVDPRRISSINLGSVVVGDKIFFVYAFILVEGPLPPPPGMAH